MPDGSGDTDGQANARILAALPAVVRVSGTGLAGQADDPSGREFRYVARPHGADGRTQWRGHLSPASRASGHVRCDDHAVRKQLIEAARRFDRTGELPENIDDECLNRVRCATVLLPKDVDWIKEPETARTADETKELAFKHHLVPDVQSALNGWRTRAAIHCPGI